VAVFRGKDKGYVHIICTYLYIGLTDNFTVNTQPRTQAQITKNRHTTVFLYRSVAKLSERAGVLGEDAENEAPGRLPFPVASSPSTFLLFAPGYEAGQYGLIQKCA
jgi:hypothetical protein